MKHNDDLLAQARLEKGWKTQRQAAAALKLDVGLLGKAETGILSEATAERLAQAYDREKDEILKWAKKKRAEREAGRAEGSERNGQSNGAAANGAANGVNTASATSADTSSTALAKWQKGLDAFQARDYTVATRLLLEALAMFGPQDAESMVVARETLGKIAERQGRYQEAAEHFKQALYLLLDHGVVNHFDQARVENLCSLINSIGRCLRLAAKAITVAVLDSCVVMLRIARAIAREFELDRMFAVSTYNLGLAYMGKGRVDTSYYDKAQSYLEEAQGLFGELPIEVFSDAPLSVESTRFNLTYLSYLRARGADLSEEARREKYLQFLNEYQASLERRAELRVEGKGDATDVLSTLRRIAELSIEMGWHKEGAMLLGAAIALRPSGGQPVAYVDLEWYQLMKDKIKEAGHSAAEEEGKKLRLEEALELALSLGR